MKSYKYISSFDHQDRLLKFQKNSSVEIFVEHLNEYLLPLQKELEKNFTHSNDAIVLILGTQRSGSTLLSQILTSRLNVGYPSNLMARFYETPSVGAYLQTMLIGDSIQSKRLYHSRHGNTQNIDDPHEFGYFWARHLGVCNGHHEPNQSELEKINIDRLNVELSSISTIFDKPLVFKCLLGSYFIPVLKKIPNVFFVDLQRNLSDSALSTLHVRQERLGSIDKWWSFRPKNYLQLKSQSPVQQVVNQLISIRSSIDNGLMDVDSDRKIKIRYNDLLQSPESFIDKLITKLKNLNFTIQKIGEPISPISKKKSSYNIDEILYHEVHDAISRIN